MTRDVRFVSPGTTLEAALALMYVHRFRHLLVIDGPHVHGLVSMRDLVYQLIRHGEGRFEAAVRDAGRDRGTEPRTDDDLMDTLLSPRRRTVLQALAPPRCSPAAATAASALPPRRRCRIGGPAMGTT